MIILIFLISTGPDLLDPLKSKVADEIIWKTRQGMIDVLAGYTPQKLLPLYVRNTLMEKNGTQGIHERICIHVHAHTHFMYVYAYVYIRS